MGQTELIWRAGGLGNAAAAATLIPIWVPVALLVIAGIGILAIWMTLLQTKTRQAWNPSRLR